DNQKIMKHPDRRQLLFDRRFRAGHLLYIGGHMKRPDSVQREPVFAGPVKELVTSPCISQPGIPVQYSGREEFNIGSVARAPAAATRSGTQAEAERRVTAPPKWRSWHCPVVVPINRSIRPPKCGEPGCRQSIRILYSCSRFYDLSATFTAF